MKKQDIKVLVSGKKEAKVIKAILEAFGEPVFKLFYDYECTVVTWDTQHDHWYVALQAIENSQKEEISVRELITLLHEQEAPVAPESILSGKVAVICTNPREAKIIADHQNKKDVGYFDGEISVYFNFKCDLMSDVLSWDFTPNVAPDYTIIPFQDFAKEVGIKVPVFVMKSEDGIDLYEGDAYQHIYQNQKGGKWYFGSSSHSGITKGTQALSNSETVKAFSTKQAAEEWVAEANKPEEIRLFGEGDECAVILKPDGSMSIDDIKIHKESIGINFPAEDVVKIIEAYKSLIS